MSLPEGASAACPEPFDFAQDRPVEGSPLVQSIKNRIACSGQITFREFMSLALYSPDNGYYTTEKNPWGGAGDYITNLDLGPAFSKTISKQIIEMWETLGRGPFTLVEAGAGRVTLSLGILGALECLCPALRKIIKVEIVERRPRPEKGLPEDVAWHGALSQLEPIASGCILSNELIDSFPVHRVTLMAGELFEIYTGFNGSAFIDAPGRPSTEALAKYLADAGVELIEGARAEINLDAVDWIQDAGQLIEKGFVMTVDYGLPAKELYSPENSPTIHCHYRHTLNNNPYANIGLQDITTHVDFTALMRQGASTGLELTGFTTQKNFLLGLGILEELKPLEAEEINLANFGKIKENQLVKQLVMPDSMGDTFKVLVQHKGIPKPELKGFSWRDMSRYLR